MRVNHVASHWPVMMQLSQRPQKIRVASMELGTPVPGSAAIRVPLPFPSLRDIAVLPLLAHDVVSLRGHDRFASRADETFASLM